MLRFLLDAHMSPGVALAVRQERPACEIESVVEWQGGRYRAASDLEIVRAARAAGLTLVTFDVRTVPGLLRTLAGSGESHAGVLLVHRKSFASDDVGGLARSIIALWDSSREDEWTDRISFLRPAE